MGEKWRNVEMVDSIMSVLKFIFMGLSDEKTAPSVMKIIQLFAKLSVVISCCYIFTSFFFQYEKANIDTFNSQLKIATEEVKGLEKELSSFNNEQGILKSEQIEIKNEQNKLRTSMLEHEKRLTRLEVIQNKLRSR